MDITAQFARSASSCHCISDLVTNLKVLTGFLQRREKGIKFALDVCVKRLERVLTSGSEIF